MFGGSSNPVGVLAFNADESSVGMLDAALMGTAVAFGVGGEVWFRVMGICVVSSPSKSTIVGESVGAVALKVGRFDAAACAGTLAFFLLPAIVRTIPAVHANTANVNRAQQNCRHMYFVVFVLEKIDSR